MALQYPPKIGNLLMCDFSDGFKEPEMIKARPVIVLATGGNSAMGTVTVVPLSTTEPDPKLDHHEILDSKSLPKHRLFTHKTSWIKGNMVYSVGLHRLSLIATGRDSSSKRSYINHRIDENALKVVQKCVLCGLNLPELAQYL